MNTLEVANRLGVRPATVLAWVRRGVIGQTGRRVRLRATRVGGRYRFDTADLAAFGEKLLAGSGEAVATGKDLETLRGVLNAR